MGKAKPKLTPAEKAKRRSHTLKHIKKYSALYAMMILPVLYFIIFKYVPMVGNILAFRRYRPGQGMFGTEWTLRYFERFLKTPRSGAPSATRWLSRWKIWPSTSRCLSSSLSC